MTEYFQQITHESVASVRQVKHTKEPNTKTKAKEIQFAFLQPPGFALIDEIQISVHNRFAGGHVVHAFSKVAVRQHALKPEHRAFLKIDLFNALLYAAEEPARSRCRGSRTTKGRGESSTDMTATALQKM